jgi:8-oxo-dGTP pyrophosphatase MutT (NUDIX family)
MNERLPEWLRERLGQPLPGAAVGADSRFATRPTRWSHYAQAPPEARPAAVLVLLYPHDGAWHLPLTLRPAHMVDHARQVSFPGGAIEQGESSADAAVREFHEELGAKGHAIRLLGPLTPLYVRTSNFRVEPWVGVTATRPAFHRNPVEVERLLEVPLAHLLDPRNRGSRRRNRGGKTFVVPHFQWQSYRIWGATCLMLGELSILLEGTEV